VVLLKICRKCGFMKSENYKTCPDCKIKLEEFEGYEEHYSTRGY